MDGHCSAEISRISRNGVTKLTVNDSVRIEGVHEGKRCSVCVDVMVQGRGAERESRRTPLGVESRYLRERAGGELEQGCGRRQPISGLVGRGERGARRIGEIGGRELSSREPGTMF